MYFDDCNSIGAVNIGSGIYKGDRINSSFESPIKVSPATTSFNPDNATISPELTSGIDIYWLARTLKIYSTKLMIIITILKWFFIGIKNVLFPL